MIKLKNLIYENDLMRESSYDKGLFKAIFFSGIPGSGKSYVLSKITDGDIQPRIVNTDKMVEYYSKEIGQDVNSEQYYNYFKDSIKRVTVNQLAGYINSLLPLFIDGTSNSLKSLFKRDGMLKSFGYDVGMIWIETDLDTAIQRAKLRDRFVPEKFIIQTYKSLEKNKAYYRSHFKYFSEIKNSYGELTDDSILSAYKETTEFFNSPIKNPVGIKNVETARNSSGYLIPEVYHGMDDIKRILSVWYNS